MIFQISNGYLIATITNYGARLMRLQTLNRIGEYDDLILGFETEEKFITAQERYYGAAIGRFANRIKNSRFSLNEKVIQLECNENQHHLHGGSQGFHEQDWQLDFHIENSLQLSLRVKHLEDKYPGDLTIKIRYTLSDENVLRVEFEGSCDRNTILNTTLHPFFCLDKSTIIDNYQLRIFSDQYLEVNQENIPTGKILKVDNSKFDFRDAQQINGHKIDHCYVFNQDRQLKLGARCFSKLSGHCIDIWMTQPGLQVYTCDYLSREDIGFNNKIHSSRSAICLEPQYFPDSPNNDHFASTILLANELYLEQIEYRFSILEQP